MQMRRREERQQFGGWVKSRAVLGVALVVGERLR
jgi:hypothetical protein